MLQRIFISYRREGAKYQARQIYAVLSQVLPSDQVFMDLGSIPLGADFRVTLRGWVDQCDFMLVLIGPGWADAVDPRSGSRRLDNPDDFVRIEVAAALARNIVVVPVMLDGAKMPEPADLPDDLQGLVHRQAEFIEFRTFDHDTTRLIARLGLAPAERPAAMPAEPSRPEPAAAEALPSGMPPSAATASPLATADLLAIRRSTRTRPASTPTGSPSSIGPVLESPMVVERPAPPAASPIRPQADEDISLRSEPRASPDRRRSMQRGRSRVLKYAAWILLAGAAAYLLSRKGVFDVFGSLVSFGASTAAPARDPDGGQEVDMSAFAPESCRKGASFIVQVLLHQPDASDVVGIALRSDRSATLKAQKTLLIPLAIGQRVHLTAAAAGCDLADEADALVWRGRTSVSAFEIHVPASLGNENVTVTIRAFREGEPIGRISFSVPVSDAAVTTVRLAGDDARHYRQTFFSYASLDRPVVVRYTHAWSLLRMRFFQDFLSLDPGERWERRLYEEIDRSDLFLLFWSTAARQSEYVRKEAEYALMRRASGQELDILPVVIEGPPCPIPPDSLSAIHFNDRHSYMIRAVMDEAASRAAN